MTSIEAENSDGVFTDELQPGTSLLRGQYVIDSFLNSGGFGMTYLARDSLERIVVIKECFPASFCHRKNNKVRARSRAQEKDFTAIVRLFVKEARQLARLEHPNIVGVHQVFEDNETAYMALDYVEGLDLLDVVENGKMTFSPEVLRTILLKTLDAVGYIHEQDILHRDISPDNILLDMTGNPVLIDFGAAREKASKASRALSALIVVKDGYSPQEFYVAGSEQGPPSDLYALAATIYHMVVGYAPPNSQTRLAAVAGEQEDPYVPLEGQRFGYDQTFLAAIDKALNVFPQDRFQTAHDWAVEIDVEKRKKNALYMAQNDRNIDRTISKLVTETNRAVLEEIEQGTGKKETIKVAPRVSKARTKMEELAREFALDAELAALEEARADEEAKLLKNDEDHEQDLNSKPGEDAGGKTRKWWFFQQANSKRPARRFWFFGKPRSENLGKAGL